MVMASNLRQIKPRPGGARVRGALIGSDARCGSLEQISLLVLSI